MDGQHLQDSGNIPANHFQYLLCIILIKQLQESDIRMKPIHLYIPGILRSGLFLFLLIFTSAIVYTTNKNIKIVRTLAVQSLTDTALGLSSAADNALRSMEGKDASDISDIFSDRVIAYAMIVQKDGNILFHTNPALINTKLPAPEIEEWISTGTFTSRRITLGTGVSAYEFNFVMYRPDKSPDLLRLVLQTTTADKMIKQAESMWWITGLLIGLLWAAGIAFERFFTHRIKTQTKRENQKRLTMIGQMTAALAHEIRNALGSVKGYAQWLDEKAEEGSPQKDALAMVVSGTLRIEALVQELLLFSREEVYKNEPVEIAPLMDEALAASTPGSQVDVEINIPPGAKVKADREKLFRVILNGIRNATDAMGQGGKLQISSHENRQSATVYIKDTGGGISEKDIDRLFTPFYTTKTDGTGLGLAYAKKVIEGMGGTIKLTNRTDGAGAVLTIELPNARSK
jgi:signal transduction histidine kinase